MVETKSLIAPDGQFEEIGIANFQIALGMTEGEIRHDLTLIDQSLQPSAEPFVAKHIARLAARTKLRPHGNFEAQLLADTLITDLRQYPPDVVAYACDRWVESREGKWFPAWAELREICERRVQPRHLLRCQLEQQLSKSCGSPAVPRRDRLTDELGFVAQATGTPYDHVFAMARKWLQNLEESGHDRESARKTLTEAVRQVPKTRFAIHAVEEKLAKLTSTTS